MITQCLYCDCHFRLIPNKFTVKFVSRGAAFDPTAMSLTQGGWSRIDYGTQSKHANNVNIEVVC
jgi:hypothetical protein